MGEGKLSSLSSLLIAWVRTSVISQRDASCRIDNHSWWPQEAVNVSYFVVLKIKLAISNNLHSPVGVGNEGSHWIQEFQKSVKIDALHLLETNGIDVGESLGLLGARW